MRQIRRDVRGYRRRGRGVSRRRRSGRRVTRRFVVVMIAMIALIAAGVLMAGRRDGRHGARWEATPTAESASTFSATVEPTPVVTATVTPEPSPTPEPIKTANVIVADAAEDARPELSRWKYRFDIHIAGKAAGDSMAARSIDFGDGSDYTDLEGIVTFRGGNFRQNAAYGSAQLKKPGFKILWKNDIGFIDSGYTKWTGVGWTGQPVMVRWPNEIRAVMNLKEAYRIDDQLIEVIYGTLDGNIYFLDARTGQFTREPIALGFPIKGSVSVDPRGYPLLYVGQGISKANGRTGKIGWRVYSLIDQKELFFLDGRDPLCLRDHGSFDGACIVDGNADTVIEGGENGLLYSIKLNTAYDPGAARIAIHPEVTTYRYKSAVSKELGIENSVAAYGRYAWFADNSGLITCLDLNAMKPVWLFDAGDDTDASIALEPEKDGGLALYTVNQVDKQGTRGRCALRRLDALTGVDEWSFFVNCDSDGDNGGGGFATPAIGARAYDDYVYFNVCRTEGGGMLYCFHKQTGEIVWSGKTGSASWSSPVLVYREDGTGVLIVGNTGRNGILSMYDPAKGKKLAEVDLKGKLEGSPAVFGDLLVVGTRGRNIFGVKLL